MHYVMPSILTATAIVIGASCSAQSRTDMIMLSMDGVDRQLSISLTDPKVMSNWEALTPDWGTMNMHGFLGEATRPELQVNLVFGVNVTGSDLRVVEPSIMIIQRGMPGFWDTSDRGEDPVINVTTYEKSDAGMLVEGTFSGTPDLRTMKTADHDTIGAIRPVSGNFSVFYPTK